MVYVVHTHTAASHTGIIVPSFTASHLLKTVPPPPFRLITVYPPPSSPSKTIINTLFIVLPPYSSAILAAFEVLSSSYGVVLLLAFSSPNNDVLLLLSSSSPTLRFFHRKRFSYPAILSNVVVLLPCSSGITPVLPSLVLFRRCQSLPPLCRIHRIGSFIAACIISSSVIVIHHRRIDQCRHVMIHVFYDHPLLWSSSSVVVFVSQRRCHSASLLISLPHHPPSLFFRIPFTIMTDRVNVYNTLRSSPHQGNIYSNSVFIPPPHPLSPYLVPLVNQFIFTILPLFALTCSRILRTSVPNRTCLDAFFKPCANYSFTTW